MTFDLLIVGQRGRVGWEAGLLAATLRHASPRWDGRLIVAEPQPGPRWDHDPRIANPELRTMLGAFGAEIVPFENKHFGQSYPQGNKIEALQVLPPDRPFLFLDSDTAILGELADLDIDFARPAASMKREDTWPVEELYGPSRDAIWGSLYAAAGLDFGSSQDTAWPVGHWRRYLYFNAGWFFGADGPSFHRAFLDAALMIRDAPPEPAQDQPLDPWLDQVALPLAIHRLGGGRPGQRGGITPDALDGSHTIHWRAMPLFYATAPDAAVATVEAAAAPNRVKKVLKGHEPFLRFLYQGRGARARALFDRTALPAKERALRNVLRRANLWMR